MVVDALEQPAQYVILLDNLRRQPEIGGHRQNFASINQLLSSRASTSPVAKGATAWLGEGTRP